MAVGRVLMIHAFHKADTVAEEIGCHAILLDVMSDGDGAAFAHRHEWYDSFGFNSFASNRARMFITMKQVRQTLSGAASLKSS